jgi:hypothetical protein
MAASGIDYYSPVFNILVYNVDDYYLLLISAAIVSVLVLPALVIDITAAKGIIFVAISTTIAIMTLLLRKVKVHNQSCSQLQCCWCHNAGARACG